MKKYKLTLQKQGKSNSTIKQYLALAKDFQDFIDVNKLCLANCSVYLIQFQSNYSYYKKVRSMLVSYLLFLKEFELAQKVKELKK